MSSRSDDGLVVYELFNKQKRKFRNRTAHRNTMKRGCFTLFSDTAYNKIISQI